jgi:phage replication-related protein YjqB (UPF0714/DUF867 family)
MLDMDVYANFTELKDAEHEGVDFRVCVVLREDASTVVLAPHGGGIEPGTSEVAKTIAKDDLSLAVFEGKKSRGNARLHMTSTRFDEPRCLALVQEADSVLAVHGEGSEEPVVFLGGRDKTLGARVRAALERHGYKVKVHKNAGLQGMAAENICNRGRRRIGVQLELSAGLRKLFFASLNTEGRRKHTDELARFAAAVREGLRRGGALSF